MNANEVIAHARQPARSGSAVHPNDHVNMGQSSNDVIPTAIHVSAALRVRQRAAAGARAPARCAARQASSELAGDREDRAHAPDGCHAGDARPGALRLAHADRATGWRGSRQSSRGCWRWRRAAPRSAPASTRIRVRRGSSAQELRAHHRRRRSRRRDNYFEAHVGAGHGGGAVRAAEGDRRQPDEDRQRPALDEQRPARRAGRDRAAGAAAGQQHHAGQGEPGDPGGHDHGGGAGDRQRCDHHDRRAVGQLPAQRDAAGDRLQPAARASACSAT